LSFRSYVNAVFRIFIFKITRNLKRRELLKTIGSAAGLGLLSPLTSSCKDDGIKPLLNFDGLVVVIGAGAAGLYTADILRNNGANVKILEASNRIGGRIRSVRLFDDALVQTDFPIELGAEVIYGTQSVWSKIINQLNLPTIKLSDVSEPYHYFNNLLSPESGLEGDSSWEAAKSFYDALRGGTGGAGTVQEQVAASGVPATMHQVLEGLIGNKKGTSNGRLHSFGVGLEFAALAHDDVPYILRSNIMQDALTSRFSRVVPNVELNTVVKRIDYNGAKVIIEGERIVGGNTETFSMEADKVVVTVPVSLLKNGDISFSPELPSSKTTALENMGMDACVRAVVDFRQNVWGAGSSFIYGGGVPEYFNTGIARGEFVKTLNVTAYGPKAEQLSALGDAMIDEILNDLDQITGGRATPNVRKNEAGQNLVMIQDWTKEPYIQGGISYLRSLGRLDDRTALGEPINDVLFFAGEATDANGEAGTVSGALLSAERVAEEVSVSILNG